MIVRKIYSGTEWDEIAIKDQDQVSFVDLEQEYWNALHNIINILNSIETIKEKIDYINNCIEVSRKICEEILKANEGKIESQNRIKLQFRHIEDWKFAIELFQKKVALL